MRYAPTPICKEHPLGCLRIRNHCPPTDDFVQLLCQSSLPASKDACAAFPCTSPKSPGGGCVAVLARRFVPRVPWKGRVEYWMYFQALYRVLWGKSLSQNQCFLIWRQPSGCGLFLPIGAYSGSYNGWGGAKGYAKDRLGQKEGTALADDRGAVMGAFCFDGDSLCPKTGSAGQQFVPGRAGAFVFPARGERLAGI